MCSSNFVRIPRIASSEVSCFVIANRSSSSSMFMNSIGYLRQLHIQSFDYRRFFGHLKQTRPTPGDLHRISRESKDYLWRSLSRQFPQCLHQLLPLFVVREEVLPYLAAIGSAPREQPVHELVDAHSGGVDLISSVIPEWFVRVGDLSHLDQELEEGLTCRGGVPGHVDVLGPLADAVEALVGLGRYLTLIEEGLGESP